MSQVLSQDSPLQNCTNTFNLSSLSSKDVSINLITPNRMRRQLSDDFIDLTTSKLVLKNPLIIDEIIISDSDDESPPKRVKNSETPFSTPKRFKSTPNLFKKTNSPLPVRKSIGLQTKLYQNPIQICSPKISPLKRINSATTIPIKCHTPQSSVRHSTPVSDLILPTPLPTHESPDTRNESMQSCPHLTPIKPTMETDDYFSQQLDSFEEDLLPTDVITIELFASNSNLCTASSETSRNVTLKTANTKFVVEDSSSTLPEMKFVQIDPAVPSVSSQLAEKLKTVAFEDNNSLQYSPPSEYTKSEYFTPKCKIASDDQFFTPFRSISSPPVTPVRAGLTLERLENNLRCYTRPNYPTKFLSDISVEGKEIPNEWIDGSINLPLEGQTSFVKINSLQFVRSCITTPHIKISKFLLTPLVTHLLTSQDVNITILTAKLLCDVIKTHPAATMDNTECYREVFTWDLLNTSIETLCSGVYIEAALDSILKLYRDVIESEIIHYQSANSSYTRSLFWPKSSCVCLSDILKDLIEYTYKLFSKHCPIIYRLFRLFEVILDWSMTSEEVLWHEQAAYEFHNMFSKLKSEDYSQFIQIISPPWFAGYIAQIRLREIGVPSLQYPHLSTNLKEFFTTHTNFLPTHIQEKHIQQSAISTPLRARLIKASKNGECRIIKQIIRDGCDPNICNERNWNPILRACCSGSVCAIEAIVETCIENNTPVNIVQINAGATPLHLAAKCDNFDVCLSLLKMGGPSLLLHRDKDGYFPFEVATLSKIVKLLRIDYDGDQIDKRAASKGFNTNLRIPIDTNIIIEFESMVCTALKGLFVKGGFDKDDVTACQQGHLFLQKLTSQINKSQVQPFKLTRLAALINSYFV